MKTIKIAVFGLYLMLAMLAFRLSEIFKDPVLSWMGWVLLILYVALMIPGFKKEKNNE